MRLRELERADVPTINRWRNDPEAVRQLGAGFHYIASEVDDSWYDDYLAHRDRAVRLIILEDDRLVGCVNLTGIHPVNRSAEFSIWIAEPSFRFRGLGRLATLEMLRHAFEDLNLHRVWLHVLATNEPALALYRKVGLKEEGRLREAVFKGGAVLDLIVMAVLRHEFRAIPPQGVGQ